MQTHTHTKKQGPPGVADILRHFLPAFMTEAGRLCPAVRRAIWAIAFCRTSVLGGSHYHCGQCSRSHFAYHSCNHRACPRCGRAETSEWVERELDKRVNAHYFLVTMTLPEAVRPLFFGPQAKDAYDLFFGSGAKALAEKLAQAKGLRAKVNGFTAVLHTWGQRMQFHPHIHFLVPGAGINANGKVVRVRSEKFLVAHQKLSGAFRAYFKAGMEQRRWQVDPDVWRRKGWGVHIEHVGDGAHAVRYLGRYVKRSVIDERRIFKSENGEVTFRWRDRSDNNRSKLLTLSGVEFVRRYLRHVLPVGLRSIRYYGFCHPAAKRNRDRIKLSTGMAICVGKRPRPTTSKPPVSCPKCQRPMRLVGQVPPFGPRAPP